MVEQIMKFTRREIERREIVCLSDLVQNIEPILSRLVGDGVELKIDASTAMKPVKVDVRQIEQVLVNIATNARDAMSGAGVMQIYTTVVEQAPMNRAHFPVEDVVGHAAGRGSMRKNQISLGPSVGASPRGAGETHCAAISSSCKRSVAKSSGSVTRTAWRS